MPDLFMKALRRATPIVLIALAPLLASPLFAQAKAQGKPLAPPTMQSGPHKNSSEVVLAVTVRDKHGNLISGLAQSDFTLSLDRHPQAIQSFTSSTSQPLTLGLMVDTSGGQLGALEAERKASQTFLDHMLNTPRDRGFLIQFAHEVDLLADVSPNKSMLHSALEQLGRPQTHNTTADQADSGERHLNTSGGDTLYDAIYLASDQLMKSQPDRKVLIVLTSGIDSGSKESLFSAIEAAQRANTIVYAIWNKGEEQAGKNSNGLPSHRRGGIGFPGGGYPGGYPGSGGGWPGGGNPQPAGRPTEGSKTDGRKILEQICSETGGRMFEVGKKGSFDQALAAIAGELQSQYLLGFTPGAKDSYSGYHRVSLTVDKKDLIVQTRQGYYAGSE
jgi:VWFA-related protein